jgi:hypothetical protein
MKRLFLLITLIVPVIANCQTFSLPTSILDTMLYEIERGRSCDSIRLEQAKLIEVQGRELIATDKALQLSKSRSDTSDQMIENLKEQVQIERKLGVNQRKQDKGKIRKLTLAAIAEALIIIILVI